MSELAGVGSFSSLRGLAASVAADNTVSVRMEPVPERQGNGRAGWVLLRTVISSVCGSDLHRFRHPVLGAGATSAFGHESVGEVLDPGDSGLLVGQSCLIVPPVEECRAFAEYQVAPASGLVALPEHLAARQAVFAQQLGTVVWALRVFLSREEVPRTALVVGAGSAGQFFVRLLRRRGVRTIVVVEPVALRRDVSLRMGADVAVADVAQLDALSGLVEFDVCIDASGDDLGRRVALSRAGHGAVVGLFGLPASTAELLPVPMSELFERNLSVKAVQNAQLEPGLRSFKEAVALIDSGQVEVSELPTSTFGLDRISAAIDDALALRRIKTMVVPREV